MKNKKFFKTISIILALICIVFLSIFLRYRYELHSLKNEIVNNKVIKVYFDGSGYTANIESDEDKKEFFNLISDFKFRFKNTMEDTEKSSPSVETEFNGNEIFLGDKVKVITPAWYQCNRVIEQGHCEILEESNSRLTN